MKYARRPNEVPNSFAGVIVSPLAEQADDPCPLSLAVMRRGHRLAACGASRRSVSPWLVPWRARTTRPSLKAPRPRLAPCGASRRSGPAQLIPLSARGARALFAQDPQPASFPWVRELASPSVSGSCLFPATRGPTVDACSASSPLPCSPSVAAVGLFPATRGPTAGGCCARHPPLVAVNRGGGSVSHGYPGAQVRRGPGLPVRPFVPGSPIAPGPPGPLFVTGSSRAGRSAPRHIHEAPNVRRREPAAPGALSTRHLRWLCTRERHSVRARKLARRSCLWGGRKRSGPRRAVLSARAALNGRRKRREVASSSPKASPPVSRWISTINYARRPPSHAKSAQLPPPPAHIQRKPPTATAPRR